MNLSSQRLLEELPSSSNEGTKRARGTKLEKKGGFSFIVRQVMRKKGKRQDVEWQR